MKLQRHPRPHLRSPPMYIHYGEPESVVSKIDFTRMIYGEDLIASLSASRMSEKKGR